MEIKVIGAVPFSFNDKDSGRLIQGINVFFESHPENDHVGVIPSKITIPYEKWALLKEYKYPCFCTPNIEQQFTSKGIKSKVIGLDFVKEAK